MAPNTTLCCGAENEMITASEAPHVALTWYLIKVSQFKAFSANKLLLKGAPSGKTDGADEKRLDEMSSKNVTRTSSTRGGKSSPVLAALADPILNQACLNAKRMNSSCCQTLSIKRVCIVCALIFGFAKQSFLFILAFCA